MSGAENDWSEDRPTFPDDPSAQHEHLGKLIRAFKMAVTEGTGGVALLSTFDALIADVENHFAAEEHAMKLARYPQLEEHVEHHAKFVSHLESLRRECERLGSLGRPLAEQVENWFVDHVQTADADAMRFIGLTR